MYRNVSLCLIGGLAMALHMSSATAVEALSTDEFVSHCIKYDESPDGEDGIFCVRYIQGFIDGAVATDERVTYNVASEFDRDETFSERAIRTRLGSRIASYGSSYYAEFCLGEPIPLKAVVEAIVAELADPERIKSHALARDVVYETLRREFPCAQEDVG